MVIAKPSRQKTRGSTRGSSPATGLPFSASRLTISNSVSNLARCASPLSQLALATEGASGASLVRRRPPVLMALMNANICVAMRAVWPVRRGRGRLALPSSLLCAALRWQQRSARERSRPHLAACVGGRGNGYGGMAVLPQPRLTRDEFP